jgi:formylglycine-generating enzyme required for sulfatase activity
MNRRNALSIVLPVLVSCGTDDPTNPADTPDASVAPDSETSGQSQSFTRFMVVVPAETFTMGSSREDPTALGTEFPAHEVTISRDFWLGKTEVTQQQYLDVVGINPTAWRDCGLDCPVDNISFGNAVAFLNELSRREGLSACYVGSDEEWTFLGVECEGYRLPTEAEWELAARAGTTTHLHSGDLTVTDLSSCEEIDPAVDAVAWYCANSEMEPHPVGLKQPNPLGLYDMIGNIWEWVNDWENTYQATAQIDPIGPTMPPATYRKMRRGGAYRVHARGSRSATRVWDDPTGHHVCVGFRVARTMLP